MSAPSSGQPTECLSVQMEELVYENRGYEPPAVECFQDNPPLPVGFYAFPALCLTSRHSSPSVVVTSICLPSSVLFRSSSGLSLGILRLSSSNWGWTSPI
jgi:hypothetical protein